MCKPYTLEETTKLTELTRKALLKNNAPELALGYLRYEALRRLTPRQFSELNARNLKGENFDRMVDELIVKNAT